jgi:signal transduction histidine kinase/CheY-like chemotaxis protein
MSDRLDQRILVLAPDRDGALTCEILSRAGLVCEPCSDEGQLWRELQRGAGALILAEEMLSDPVRHELTLALEAQPPWSDLPVLVVAIGGDHGGRLAGLASMRSVSVLSRPMAIDTLVTAVQSALRARLRQYEVRDLLLERESAARRKDEFLAMLAHELRNPLAPVRYGVQILRDQCGSENDKVAHAISLVDRQVAHMARLIEDLLDVSRLTRGVVQLKLQRIDLSRLQRDVVDARQGIAQSKRISLEVVSPGQPIWIEGDTVRLTQVVDNLIDNAVKFSRPGGRIVVGSRIEEGQAVLWVEDDGEGLDSSILSNLFESFSQADRSLDRNKGGLGLGLAIVHGIVLLHGGEVTAASDGPGQGAKFTLRLPLAVPSESAAAVSPRGPANSERQQLKVLVVEDNHASAELLRMMLSLYGHVVEVAHNGQEGIAAAQRFEPDVMLCDIGLPGMSGYEVAEAIRSQAAAQAGRLVAITGYGDPEHRRRAFKAGFDAHLVKPVNPEELLKVLCPSLTSGSLGNID